MLKQKDFVANAGGSPFSVFGNDYGFNVGFEHREEDGSFQPDAFQQAGLGRSVAITPISGKYTVNEEFGEGGMDDANIGRGLVTLRDNEDRVKTAQGTVYCIRGLPGKMREIDGRERVSDKDNRSEDGLQSLRQLSRHFGECRLKYLQV